MPALLIFIDCLGYEVQIPENKAAHQLNPDPNSDEVEKFLHQEIPLTRAMGLRVVGNDARGFVVEAPVAKNSNHLRTAFGGSINAVATLAGYGWLWVHLEKGMADVVVRESSIRFRHPIRSMIRAICAAPEKAMWEALLAEWRARGKARVRLRVRVEEDARLAAEWEGEFVAFRRANVRPT